MCDLAQELTKDPYNFAFTGITGRYNERLLKDSLLNNITNFLIELGTGFAYIVLWGIVVPFAVCALVATYEKLRARTYYC